jgi:hypothetical protein
VGTPLAIVDPLRSGDTGTKLLMTARVDGQYFMAHCMLREPWDQVITLTFLLFEMAET